MEENNDEYNLENEYKEAALIENGEKFTIIDAVKIVGFIKGTLDIEF